MIAGGIYADTLYVVALSGFAALVLLATLVGRRALSVISKRSEMEAVKLDISLDQLKHQRVVAEHGQQKALLQLTAGSDKEKEEVRKKDEERRRATDLKPETVNVGPHEIHSPTTFRTKDQWREEGNAAEGEWQPAEA